MAAGRIYDLYTGSGAGEVGLGDRIGPDLVVAGLELGGDRLRDLFGRPRALGLVALGPLGDVVVGRIELALDRDDVDQLLEPRAQHQLVPLARLLRVDLGGDFLPIGDL